MSKMLLNWFIVASLISLFLAACNNKGYDTLQEAVQSQWETKIEIVNWDKEKQV